MLLFESESGYRKMASAPVVLVADDDEMIRSLLVRVMTREGYSVLAASDAQEALEISRTYNGTIDLLITDVVMPGLNGVDLCGCLVKERPGIRAMLITGADVEKTRNSNLPMLTKPFQWETLKAKVREVLAAS